MGPANNSKNIIEGFEKLKSLKLFLIIKKNIRIANGSINKLSINKPISVSTFIFFLNKL